MGAGLRHFSPHNGASEGQLAERPHEIEFDISS